jgi:4-diphosphocytidyl-2-C-methyl-D-erythritol kinase
MQATAYAKLNLALHVRGLAADGYHRIETAFAFCEDGDRLEVAEGDGLSLSVVGPFADRLTDCKDNIVLRAARALRDHCGIEGGARLILDKRLPVAAGLGGGSADAAAALRLLCDWWASRVPQDELAGLASALGADVPACLYSRSALGRGRGDMLEFADFGVGQAPALLVNPGAMLSTRDVFARWDGRDRGPLENPRLGRNDLEEPAASLAPEIRDVLNGLDSLGTASLTRMSGSGATCFALFEDEADRDEASRRVAASHPHWWQLATRLR